MLNSKTHKKIALTGPSGSGKTTLLKKVMYEFKYFETLGSISSQVQREIGSTDFNNLKDTFDFQYRILNKKHYLEKNVLKHNNLIIDRAYVDSLIYTYTKLMNFDIKKEEYQKFEEYKKKVMEYDKNYDLIFYVMPFTNFPEKNDKNGRINKYVNPIFNDVYNTMLHKFLKYYKRKLNLNIITVFPENGKIEERYKTIKTYMKYILKDMKRGFL